MESLSKAPKTTIYAMVLLPLLAILLIANFVTNGASITGQVTKQDFSNPEPVQPEQKDRPAQQVQQIEPVQPPQPIQQQPQQAPQTQPTGSSTAYLSVDSNPVDIQVYLDNTFLGLTPLKDAGVATGKHTIKFQKPGYSTFESDVFIIPGQNHLNIFLSTLRNGQSGQ